MTQSSPAEFPVSDDKYEVIVSQVTIVRRGEPIFDGTATHVILQDLAAGEFVEIRQTQTDSSSEQPAIAIEADTWPLIRQTVEAMLSRARF
jgi:hypothetical protein